MKVRVGFVSNSSSSSFVVIGFKLEYDRNKDQGPEEMIEELRKTCPELKIDYVDDDGPKYVGKIIMDVSDEDGGMDIEEIDWADIEGYIIKMTSHADDIEKIIGVRPKIKIYYGTRRS